MNEDKKETPQSEESEEVSKQAETVEAEVVEPEKKAEKPAVKAKVVVSSEKKAPPTPEKRAEIKKELTAADGKADELQLQTLKALMMRWVNEVPSDKEMATAIMVKTNAFETCTRKDAEELIDVINKKIAEGTKKG